MAEAMGLTYEELVKLAEENYTKGGDVVCECWDKEFFDTYVEMFGPMTRDKALKMFEETKDMEEEQYAIMFGY